MCYHDSNFRYHSEIGIPINDLVESLGVTGILRFLEQFKHGRSGDYIAKKYENKESEPLSKKFGCNS